MRFLVYAQLRPEKGIPYSNRHLKRLEAQGKFPKRVPLAGGILKGWPETVIDEHIDALADEFEGGSMTAVMIGLGALLRATKDHCGIGLGELTVLSPQNDPFRLDTPTNHEVGKWFLNQMKQCGLLSRTNPIHNRGVHYAIVSRDKIKLPSGLPYKNDLDCWDFLERASKAARWLGYVPFEKIIDARNAEPIIRIVKNGDPRWFLSVMPDMELPEAEDIEPRVCVDGFASASTYRLVFFGEKTSLGEVLDPLAKEFGADLYLPSGEISDTLLATMAQTGADDGREMVVFVFADCDPAGYQMAVSIGHKLRALKEAFHPSLKFQVHAPCLTVEQVGELGLPSTPLKETERRAAGWRERYGVEQTEIDALATLNPRGLRRIVRQACAPFFDATLAQRLNEAERSWQQAAQEAFDQRVDPSLIEEIRDRAETSLAELKVTIEQMEVAVEDLDIDLPPMELPEPEVDLDDQPEPLVSSDMELIEAINVLRARKDYSNGGAP